MDYKTAYLIELVKAICRKGLEIGMKILLKKYFHVHNLHFGGALPCYGVLPRQGVRAAPVAPLIMPCQMMAHVSKKIDQSHGD